MATAVTVGPGNIAADTKRKPSSSIWHDCNIQEIRAGFVDGFIVEDDFMELPITAVTSQATSGKYMIASTTGTVTAGAGPGGEVALTTAADNANASIGFYSFPFKLNSSQKKLWFECRFKTSTIANTVADMFVGLMDNVAISTVCPITATTGTSNNGLNALATTMNAVGFFHPGAAVSGSGGSTMSSFYQANAVTPVAVGANIVTLVADTYIKLGFVYDPVDLYLRFYTNGVEDSNKKLLGAAAGTDFPDDVYMGFVFAQVGTASTSGLGTLDWVKCVQLA